MMMGMPAVPLERQARIDAPASIPLRASLFPASYMVHIAEEFWAGEGFPSWASRHTGLDFNPSRFLAINGAILAVMLGCAALAVRRASWRWLVAALASAVSLNAAAHVAASFATHSYSPGAISGALLWMPLGVVTLVRCARSFSRRELFGGIAAGLAAHAVVTLSAIAISSVAGAPVG